MSVVETVEPLLIPVIQAQGVELYDLEYIKEGGDRILRLYIDKEDGVTLEDCESVSHAAEAVLDAHDPIPSAYVLEVSSPGIERKLKKDSHFIRYIGHKITLRLFAAIDPVYGRKKYTGILTGYENGVITIKDEEDEIYSFNKNQVSVCKLVVF
jgi:ribosome maturation factor RimP